MSGVSTTHKEYDDNIRKIEKVRDTTGGSGLVKGKGKKYLPMPNPGDLTTENLNRYEDYKTRANYVNFVGMTLEGMLGMVFRNDMRVELPVSVKYLNENADGNGLSLEQFTRMSVSEVLKGGRYGYLVDYPEAPEGLSAVEVEMLELMATIKPYKAENIINWRTSMRGGKKILSLVVLKETHEEVSENGFSSEDKEYHRVLRLEDGVYQQELYNEDDEIVKITQPRKFDGSFWNYIPFTFIGAENNDERIDKSPLYDIAEINIAHYRNSADFEESCFIVGQPTPWISGLNQTWVQETLKDGVTLGSRSAVLLPEGGELGLAQVNENVMPERGMAEKELQMIKLGARLITDAGGKETAEAARIRYAGQNSKLATVVGNVEDALIKAVGWVMEFMSADESDIELKINREFYDKQADPQLIMANIQLLDRGVIAMSDLRSNLRGSGVLEQDRTDEEIDGEAEEGMMDD